MSEENKYLARRLLQVINQRPAAIVDELLASN